MLERVAGTIQRYNMFGRGHRVGVAVSGGADSVALLHALLELAPRWALRLRVLHLNHQLRGEESERDAEFVRTMARELGLEADIETADLPRLHAEQGGNLEQLARRARMEFFLRRIREGAVGRVALGHTLSDQAETVLFRILRGCGLRGLAGIRPVTPEGIVRPLIEVERASVVAFLRERGLAWREDSSNADRRFARNRIRHDLLPRLAREWNPALPEALARLAELAREEEEHGRREAERLVETLVSWDGPAALLRAPDLAALDPVAARRLLRLVAERLRGNLNRLEFRHIEAVLELARREEGGGGVDLPGLVAQRSFDWIRLALPEHVKASPSQTGLPVDPPCTLSLPGGGRVLRFSLVTPGEILHATEAAPTGQALDWDELPRPLVLRPWKPGDRYQPVGHDHPVSLKTLFQKHRVPSWERANWPVLEAAGRIVWALRFGPAREYAAGPSCPRLLFIGQHEQNCG